MYCDYWKLDKKPFKATFDEKLISFKGYFAEAYHKLDLYLTRMPVSLCFRGKKGTGKSLLLRMIEKACLSDLHVVMLPGKHINERISLLRLFEESQPLSNTRDHRTLAHKINSHFSSPENLHKGMLFIIDDAQYLYDPEVINDLAESARICEEKHFPVAFVFAVDLSSLSDICGAFPELKIIDFGLPSAEDLGEIINLRIEKCGGKSSLFSEEALEIIIEMANHDIRELLMLADLSLQMGYVNKLKQIDKDLLQKKVMPFLKQFRDDDNNSVEIRNKAKSIPQPKHALHLDKKPEHSPPKKEAQAISSEIKPEKLINRAELESYRIESIKAPKRREIDELEKMILSGKLDLAKAIKANTETAKPQKKSVKEIEKEEVETTAEKPLLKLNAHSLYQVGTQLVTGILDKLRRQVRVPLESTYHFIDALIVLIKKDSTIIRKAVDSSVGYGLNVHMLNVSILSTACALNMNLTKDEVIETSTSALLHDIGHLQSGENLLTSNSRFSRQDFKTIKEHPLAGQKMILSLTDGSKRIAEIISQEHERDDGLGYPNYLVGSEILLPAKIVAVCDVYEALTHSRSYRTALEAEDALNRIKSGMIHQTDPKIISSLNRVILPVLPK